jgi:hypothetical protein
LFGVFKSLTLGAASPSEAPPSMSNPQTSNDHALHQRPTKTIMRTKALFLPLYHQQGRLTTDWLISLNS